MYLSVSVRIVEATCKTKLNVPVEEFIGIVKPVSYTHLTLPTNREV